MEYSRWYDDNVSIISSSWSKKHYVRKIDNVTVNLDTMKRVTKIQLLSKETIQRNWHAYSKYMERTRYETSSEMETMGLQRTNIKLHSVDLAKNFDNVLEIRAAQLSTFHPWSETRQYRHSVRFFFERAHGLWMNSRRKIRTPSKLLLSISLMWCQKFNRRSFCHDRKHCELHNLFNTVCLFTSISYELQS